jgi:hypothetical protein
MTYKQGDNPFVMVWNGLWEMVERNPRLCDLIKPGNRTKFEERSDHKDAVSDADLPELALLMSGGLNDIMDSSSTSRVSRKYTWAIATGEFQINPYYNSITWELYRSMIDWDIVLAKLQWPEGWHFVVRVNIINISEGTMMERQNRGIIGWAGMWQIDVQMHFNTESLRIVI